MDPSSDPALAPPAGVISDFNAPNEAYKWNILCQAVCLTLSTLLVGARMYTKLRITRKVGLEDYTCCIAWLSLLAYSILCSIIAENGGGSHLWNMSKGQFGIYLRLVNASQVLYNLVTMVTKVSILLLFFAIFATTQKDMTYWLIQTTLWMVVLFNIIVTFVKIFQCSPVAKIWTPSLPGTCLNLSAIFYSTGIFNLITDLVILVLPIRFTWRLRMRLKQKLAISAIFAVGSLAPIATALRLTSTIQGSTNKDVTYWQYPMLLWTVGEITTGLICSCMPTIPALFRHYVPKLRTQHHPSTSSKHSHLSSKRIIPSSRAFSTADDPFLNAGYIGLQEPPATLGVTTRIRGETESEKTRNDLDSDCPDEERGKLSGRNNIAGDGIVKTVHIEQFS